MSLELISVTTMSWLVTLSKIVKKVAIIGANGIKSTLLKTITGRIDAKKGSRNF